MKFGMVNPWTMQNIKISGIKKFKMATWMLKF